MAVNETCLDVQINEILQENVGSGNALFLSGLAADAVEQRSQNQQGIKDLGNILTKLAQVGSLYGSSIMNNFLGFELTLCRHFR